MQTYRDLVEGRLEGVAATPMPQRTYFQTRARVLARREVMGLVTLEPEPEPDYWQEREERIGRTIRHLESLVGAEG